MEVQHKALARTFVPIGIGQAIAGMELATQADIYKDDGLLKGRSANRAKEGTVRWRMLKTLDHPSVPRVLGVVLSVAGLTLVLFRRVRPVTIACSAVIGIAHKLLEIRTPYGRDGADQMVGVITRYRLLTAAIPDVEISDDLFLRAVNAQTATAYVASGAAKAISSAWMQGHALNDVLQTEVYGSSPAAKTLKRFPRFNRFVSVLTAVWETLFPVVYFLPRRLALFALGMVKLFHAGIAVVMELPRFFWGFVAAHGAVQYVIETRGRQQ